MKHLTEQPLTPGSLTKLRGKVCSAFHCEKGQPGAPDSENANSNVRSGTLYGVAWSQQYGCQCPQCGLYSKRAYRHMPWKDSCKVRYHRCPACEYHFKSVACDK